MWFYEFCSFVCLIFSIHCHLVESIGPNIYLTNNPVGKRIKNNENFQQNFDKQFLEFNSITSDINSKDSIIKNVNEQQQLLELELQGLMVIMKKLRNEDEKLVINYPTSQNNPTNKKDRVNLRSDNQNQLILVDTSEKKESAKKKGLSISDPLENGSTEIDHLSRNTLRVAASIACIALAVRKCFEALYKVNRTVCKRRFKCMKNFRSHFRNKSKQSCIEEFDYTKGHKTSAVKYRGKFVDATRGGYLKACMPYMAPDHKGASKSITLRNDTTVNSFAKRMLRSMSEKRCQYLSRVKCVKACNFA